MRFTRDNLRGAQTKAREVLDMVDTYIDARSCAAGVLHMPECRLHVHAQHWDWLDNALKRGGRSLTTDTYRGITLLRQEG